MSNSDGFVDVVTIDDVLEAFEEVINDDKIQRM